LKTPPRRACAPQARTARAVRIIWSGVSTEQGPVITAKPLPPITQFPIRTTDSPTRDCRAAFG
jgi:hypothetical protein